MNAATLQGFIDTAIGQLDHLDPILGYDLQWVCAVRPIDNGQLKVIYDECLKRANEWPGGSTVRMAWNNVLDCLIEISHSTVKGGI